MSLLTKPRECSLPSAYPGYCRLDMSTSSSHYIVLSRNPLRFDAVGRSNSVFFDEANKEVDDAFPVEGRRSRDHLFPGVCC